MGNRVRLVKLAGRRSLGVQAKGEKRRAPAVNMLQLGVKCRASRHDGVAWAGARSAEVGHPVELLLHHSWTPATRP